VFVEVQLVYSWNFPLFFTLFCNAHLLKVFLIIIIKFITPCALDTSIYYLIDTSLSLFFLLPPSSSLSFYLFIVVFVFSITSLFFSLSQLRYLYCWRSAIERGSLRHTLRRYMSNVECSIRSSYSTFHSHLMGQPSRNQPL
jgi:hypothetical protein